VGEGGAAAQEQASKEPPEVARRDAQEVGGFPSVQDAIKDTRQHMHALVLSLDQVIVSLVTGGNIY
jgi:hypothetical protein